MANDDLTETFRLKDRKVSSRSDDQFGTVDAISDRLRHLWGCRQIALTTDHQS